jgi:YidC/Oxa1 family membrane protein insertase
LRVAIRGTPGAWTRYRECGAASRSAVAGSQDFLERFFLLTLLGFANPFGPVFNSLVVLMSAFIDAVNGAVHNYGWSLIVVALIITLALFPLKLAQYRSMSRMQALQPKIKALQKKYSGKDPETVQALNTEMMALYKTEGVNPFAGCIPAIIPLPFIIAVYYAISQEGAKFAEATWLWIGAPISQQFNHILATSLAKPDYALLIIYMASMYFSIRYASPPTTPEMEQQQKIMAFVSPAMIGWFGYQYHWASGLLIYWIAFNLFTMGQQVVLMRTVGERGKIEVKPGTPQRERVLGAPSPAGANADGNGSAKPLSNTQRKKQRRSRR